MRGILALWKIAVWVPDEDHCRLAASVDPVLCIGVQKCVSKGPTDVSWMVPVGRHRHGGYWRVERVVWGHVVLRVNSGRSSKSHDCGLMASRNR